MSVLGTELKINVNVKPIGSTHLSACNFTCTFFVSSNKTVVKKKEDMIKIDDDNYIALINSEDLGAGTIKMTIKVLVPDPAFEDNYRTEIETVSTGITIKK
jgi:hypothetical protein